MQKQLSSFNCPNCGATLSISIRSNKNQCEYCHSVIAFDHFKDLYSSKSIPKTNLKWISTCTFPDRTRFVTDGNFIIDTSYLSSTELLPGENIPIDVFNNILNYPFNYSFELIDLRKESDCDVILAPNNIGFNENYIDILSTLNYTNKLVFHSNLPYDPIILFDGDKKIGALMGMKWSR